MRERAARSRKTARGTIARFVAAAAGLIAFAALPACGNVTSAPADLCVGGCDAGACAQEALTVTGATPKTQCAPATPAADAAARPVAMPTDVFVPACTICRRAENCCKAAGHADCGYTAACANASTSDEQNQVLVLCYALVDSGHDPTGRRCGEY